MKRFSMLLCLIMAACSSEVTETAAVAQAETAESVAQTPLTPEQQETAAFNALWTQWNDPVTQRVEPFRIFDNLFYVGMEWVAAYLLVTDEGLVLIDSLYPPWTGELIDNIRRLGFDPADLAFVIVTHGHFDHAGGAAQIQSEFGAKVVMSAEDWALAAQPAQDPRLAMTLPSQDIVATDRDFLTVGSTRITFLHTPGHTPGVLSLRYQVFDNGTAHEAITLGGVGRNFSGVTRTEAYIASYERLLRESKPVSVSLPNHAAMAQVFERHRQLQQRAPDAPHPFVDHAGYVQALETFLAAGRQKLVDERAGTARSALEELSDTLNSDGP